jgi:hypothetical protein
MAEAMFSRLQKNNEELGQVGEELVMIFANIHKHKQHVECKTKAKTLRLNALIHKLLLRRDKFTNKITKLFCFQSRRSNTIETGSWC